MCCNVAFVAGALSLGASFSHVLEMPRKLPLGARDYLLVQTIYRSFGPLAAFLEPLTLVALVGVAVTAKQHAAPIVALIMFALSVIVWLTVVNPMNGVMAGWGDTPPATWTTDRDRWEWGHVAVFTLKLVAYVALVHFALARIHAHD
jgi:hypothetical protein